MSGTQHQLKGRVQKTVASHARLLSCEDGAELNCRTQVGWDIVP